MRRLPIYLLLDCSESMIGPGIEGLRSALAAMLRELRRNPQALESVSLSIITFDSEARQAVPLTPLDEVQVPTLSIRPGTALGAALLMANDAIRREVKRTTVTEKGDFRPLIFLITDGQPTDNWQAAQRLLDTRSGTRPANFYAIGCGYDVDYAQLGKLTDIVLKLDQVNVEGFAKLFVWLSASVHSASTGIADKDPGALLANLPKDIVKVDLTKVPPGDGRSRQLFLRAHCLLGKGAYLMRYRLDESSGTYEALSAHELEKERDGANAAREFQLPPVDSRQLAGCPPCPYCRNDSAGSCNNCQGIFCLSSRNPPEQLTCPCCRSTLTMGTRDENGIQIRQSHG